MANATAEKLDVDSFVAAFEGQIRWELRDGRPVKKMASEQVAHVRAKYRACRVLEAAIARAGVPCEAFTEGLVVRIDEANAFEPDALVNCGNRLADNTIVAPNPVIVVEVVSPSSAAFDRGPKRAGYFSVASVAHYLVVDTSARTLEHYFRKAAGGLDGVTLSAGEFRLDPPGLELSVEAFFSD